LPFQISFYDEEDEPIILIFISYFTDLLYLTDVVLIFFTVDFNKNDDLIVDKKVIARNYLRGWFVPDLLTCLPFELFLPNNKKNDLPKLLRVLKLTKIRKFVKMFRIVRVSKILREYKKLEDYFEKKDRTFSKESERLIMTVLAILVFCHV